MTTLSEIGESSLILSGTPSSSTSAAHGLGSGISGIQPVATTAGGWQSRLADSPLGTSSGNQGLKTSSSLLTRSSRVGSKRTMSLSQCSAILTTPLLGTLGLGSNAEQSVQPLTAASTSLGQGSLPPSHTMQPAIKQSELVAADARKTIVARTHPTQKQQGTTASGSLVVETGKASAPSAGIAKGKEVTRTATSGSAGAGKVSGNKTFIPELTWCLIDKAPGFIRQVNESVYESVFCQECANKHKGRRAGMGNHETKDHNQKVLVVVVEGNKWAVCFLTRGYTIEPLPQGFKHPMVPEGQVKVPYETVAAAFGFQIPPKNPSQFTGRWDDVLNYLKDQRRVASLAEVLDHIKNGAELESTIIRVPRAPTTVAKQSIENKLKQLQGFRDSMHQDTNYQAKVAKAAPGA